MKGWGGYTSEEPLKLTSVAWRKKNYLAYNENLQFNQEAIIFYAITQ